jgi:hypothetical protein
MPLSNQIGVAKARLFEAGLNTNSFSIFDKKIDSLNISNAVGNDFTV